MKKYKIWWTEKNSAEFELEDDEEVNFESLHEKAVVSGDYAYEGLDDGDFEEIDD